MVTQLRCGARMLVDRANAVDRVIYLFGDYDREEIEWLLGKVQDSQAALFLDIGSNIGAYSVIMSTLSPSLESKAFEPDQRNLAFLRANLVINELEDRVEVIEAAVGEVSGTTRFLESRADALFNTGKSRVVSEEVQDANVRTVEKVTIDEYLEAKGRILLLKVDVEGYEMDVIRGMKETLTSNNCFLVIEVFPENLNDCDELMGELGYRRTVSFGSDDWGYEPA